ncbi:hypothetical protein, partial [Pantoea ananatis]|uniref:hypothetical protein n=1 Tax=Pantoea ananas TaxID=553 RepID=UPI001B31759F
VKRSQTVWNAVKDLQKIKQGVGSRMGNGMRWENRPKRDREEKRRDRPKSDREEKRPPAVR